MARRSQLWLTALIVTALLAVPRAAYGHSMAYYASTPVSPPQGFVWVAFSFWALALGVGAVLMRKLGQRGWVSALALSLATTALFSTLFLGIGVSVAHANTAPPPGLGWAYPVQWGLAHEAYTHLVFTRWNIGGVALLAAVAFVSSLVAARGRLRLTLCVVGAQVAVYLLCLVPYVSTGALTHGWAGGYVRDRCEYQIEDLGQALVSYADEHAGRLPTASDIRELCDRLAPYLPDWYWADDRHVYECPVGSAFEPKPVLYVWNRRFSGARLKDLEALSPPALVLACPYPRRGVWQPFALFARDLFAADEYLRRRAYQVPLRGEH